MFTKKIAKLEAKIETLFAKRSQHFHDADETVYYQINRKLNAARADLKRALHMQLMFRTWGTCPKTPRNSMVTRYETLPQAVAERIEQHVYFLGGSHLYRVIDGPIARTLRDAVAYVEKINRTWATI